MIFVGNKRTVLSTIAGDVVIPTVTNTDSLSHTIAWV